MSHVRIVTWRLDYRRWLFQVLTWDGALPLVVLGLPEAATRLFPHCPGLVEFLAIALPIAAFLIRFYAGKCHIRSNACGRTVRKLQLLFLCLGIFVLLVFDSLCILSKDIQMRLAQVQPRNDWKALAELLLVAGVAWLVYLPCAAFAMYPGKTMAVPLQWRDVDPRTGIRRSDVEP